MRLLCRTLPVSPAGFYASQKRTPAGRMKAEARLGVDVATIYAESRPC